MTPRPSAAELLQTRGALLTTSDIAELGLSRRAIATVFRQCPHVLLPGHRRPMVVSDVLRRFLEQSTHDNRGEGRLRAG
jgi:hypothetical protein